MQTGAVRGDARSASPVTQARKGVIAFTEAGSSLDIV
jgi:hypothetical protein